MDIGQKLKNARVSAGMTQEKVAEKINVSRQTISNWENNKSYPDIHSVLSLSDLYSISLDKLLKGDDKMIAYLEKSTDTVKSRQTFSKLILIISYLVIWALCILTFWFGGKEDALGFSIMVLYLVLPVSTLVISIFIGKDESWTNWKWCMLLFFGFLYMLAPYATFGLANMISVEMFRWPNPAESLPGIISAAIGLLAGSVIHMVQKRRNSRPPRQPVK